MPEAIIFELPRDPDTKMKREMWDGVLNFFIEGSLQNFFRRTKRIQDSNGFIAMVLVQNFSFNKGTCLCKYCKTKVSFLSHG